MANKNEPTDNSAQDGIFYAPWKKNFDRIITPFEEFIHRQTTSGMLLMLMAIVYPVSTSWTDGGALLR